MPHLAPFAWMLTPLLFWFVMMSILAYSWWSQAPSFSSRHSPNSMMKNSNWIWN